MEAIEALWKNAMYIAKKTVFCNIVMKSAKG